MNANAQITSPIDLVSDTDHRKLPSIPPKMAELLAFTQRNQASITPKEINATLAKVLESYDELTAVYAQNSQRLDAELALIREVGSDVSGRLQQLHADVQQQQHALVVLGKETQTSVQSVHTELHVQLAHRDSQWDAKLGSLQGHLEQDIGALDNRIGSLQEIFTAQEQILTEQASRLDQFGVAQELLDTATRGNRNRIEGVREMADRQHAIAKAQIEGLRALQREHYTEFQTVQSLVGVLQHEMHSVVRKLHDLSNGLDSHVVHTDHRFKWTHAALVGLLVLMVSGFALSKWSPAFTPVSTNQAVSQLDQRISGIGAQVTDLAPLQAVALEQQLKMNQITGQVVQLEKNLADLGNSVRTIRTIQVATSSNNLNGLPTQDGLWLLKQNPKAFTVQVLGAPDPAEVKRFIDNHASQFGDGGFAYSVTERDSQARFNLFYGLFPSASEARAATNALPSDIRANKPWVRQLQSIQASLR